MTAIEQRRKAVLGTLMLAFPGPELPDETTRWLDQGLAGVVLFARNVSSLEQLTQLCARIREINPDAIIALDEEGGEVTRLEASSGSSWPGARALGTVDDPDLTRNAGLLIGEAIARVGATVNLAPVADVDSNGTYAFGNRTFSTSSLTVAEHVRAFVDGTQAAGVAACVKHFPGHGATEIDSHLELPTVNLDRSTLLADHMAPFVAAIQADVAMIMAAHVRYPRIDDAPATVSYEILTEIARRELGFDGVITTDALEMGAIADRIGIAAAAPAALQAGADLLCLCSGLEQQREVLASLEVALARGDLAAARLEEAAVRVSRLAGRYRGDPAQAGGQREITEILGEAHVLGLAAVRRALSLGPQPGSLQQAPYVVELTTRVTGIGDVRTRLTGALAQRDARTKGRAFAADAIPNAADVLAAADGRQIVIATRDAFRHAAQRELVKALLSARPESVVVGLGLSADAELAPGRFIPALGAAPPNLAAVAEVLVPETRGL